MDKFIIFQIVHKTVIEQSIKKNQNHMQFNIKVVISFCFHKTFNFNVYVNFLTSFRCNVN